MRYKICTVVVAYCLRVMGTCNMSLQRRVRDQICSFTHVMHAPLVGIQARGLILKEWEQEVFSECRVHVQ